ncbi:MAG: glycosyltransferase family 1 protein [Melioribacter sp.]|nr:glycosyltransferase family 1 protein [Melioribacter sp.]
MIESIGVVLKVLHINSFDKKGGAETVFKLSRSNKATENYCGFVKTKDLTENPDILFRSWENDNKLSGTINYIFSIYNYRLLRSFLKKVEIDVIHLHGFFSSISPSILLAIKKTKQIKKIKVVQTLHDFHLICPNASLYNYNKKIICEKCVGKKIKLDILFENCDRRGWIHSIIKGIRSFAANNILTHREIVDEFICPSNFLKSKLIQDGIDEKRIAVIRNPIVSLDNTTIPKKKNIICYFGRFSKEKNLDFLINAFTIWKEKINNDFQLLFIGEGEEEENLKFLAHQSLTKENVSFKNYLPYKELVNTIKEVKYLAMSSMCYENFPMSIVEGMSLNILPIVPSIGGMKESVEILLQFGKTYLPNNIESWIESINFLENNYEEQLQKLIHSKKKITEELSVKKYYDSVRILYSS